MTLTNEMLLAVLGAIFSVLWFLLRQKDAAQAEQIKTLFRKHDEDAAALQELKIQIAEGHYKKVELDYKFDKLELAIVNSFTNLGMKFDNLTKALLDHISKEDKGK